MQLQKASKAKQYKRHGGGCFCFILSFAGCANGFYECQGRIFRGKQSAPE
nr:MAG TPA: hypothetical protein [Bacteriophage sp.]